MKANQIAPRSQVNQSFDMGKKQAVENKVKAIMSQLPGKVRNIQYSYQDSTMTKAKITVVVSSEAEAQKVRKNVDESIDLKVIVLETNEKSQTTKEDEEISNNGETYQPSKKNDNEESKIIQDNTYSFNRGPNGKIYGMVREKDDKPTNIATSLSENKSLNKNMQDKYIKLYKRYNFKNIKIKENQSDDGFSIRL